MAPNYLFMRSLAILAALTCSLALLPSCKKNTTNHLPYGTYKGTFTIDGEQVYKNVGIVLNDNSYYCTDGTQGFPGKTKGSYSINGNTLNFNAEAYDASGFVINYFMDGTYTYSMTGRRLQFVGSHHNHYYVYNLELQ